MRKVAKTLVNEARKLKEYNNKGIRETYEHFELGLYVIVGAIIVIFFAIFAGS